MVRTSCQQTLGVAVLCSVCAWAIVNKGPAQTTGMAHLQLTSTAFADGNPIPTEYTCQGRDISPPLRWTGVPSNARSLALIVDDPDAPAGTWVHWVLYNLPPNVTELRGNASRNISSLGKAAQGLNDFGRTGYGGPCPPPGKAHRYFFKLYALDSEFTLKSDPAKKDLEQAMQGHVLADGQLMGTYLRR